MYPCNCDDMKWMVDNNKLVKKEGDHWVLTWIELDKTEKGINIENLGVKFHFCPFCSKDIKG